MKSEITYETEKTLVKLLDPFNENVDKIFSQIIAKIKFDHILFDLDGVTTINSFGGMHWMKFLKSIENTKVDFVQCSVEFITYINVLPDFKGHGTLFSYYVPYHCLECSIDFKVEYQSEQFTINDEFPPKPCSGCSKEIPAEVEANDYLEGIAT
jgi:hypothetical protein